MGNFLFLNMRLLGGGDRNSSFSEIHLRTWKWLLEMNKTIAFI